MRPMDRRGFERAPLLLLVLALVVSGCTGARKPADQSQGAKRAVSVQLNSRAGHVVLPGGAELGWRTGTFSQATLRALSVPSPAPAPTSLVKAGLSLSITGVEPKHPVTLSFPASDPGWVATFDPASEAWTSVPTRWNSKAHRLVAIVRHFSVWSSFTATIAGVQDAITGAFKAVFGVGLVAVPPPTCANPATDVTVAIANNDPAFAACVDAVGTSRVLHVSSRRKFAVAFLLPPGSQALPPPPSDLSETIRWVLAKIGSPTYLVVPSGVEGQANLAVPSGTAVTILSQLDAPSYLLDTLDTAISELSQVAGKSVVDQTIHSAADIYGGSGCLAKIVAPGGLASVGAQFDAAARASLWKAAWSCVGVYLKSSPLGELNAVYDIVTGLAAGLGQGVEGLIDTIVGHGLPSLTVARKSTITLSGTGLGPGLQFGTGLAPTVAALDHLLGPHTTVLGSTPDNFCTTFDSGPGRAYRWGPLVVTFINGHVQPDGFVPGQAQNAFERAARQQPDDLHLWGWSYGSGPTNEGSDSLHLETPRGVSLGTSFARVQAAYGALALGPGPQATTNYVFTAPDGINGTINTSVASRPVSSLTAGSGCGE